MIQSIIEANCFLDRLTIPTNVVFLTEQPESSLRRMLQFARLLDRPELTILRWHRVWATPWADIVAEAIEQAHQREAGLLVVDTLPHWAGFRGDDENKTGPQLEAYRPLLRAAGEGLGVWCNGHERKSGGPIADAMRGNSAGPGEVDIILSLRAVPDKPNVRKLESAGRFEPISLEIELTEEGYSVATTNGQQTIRRMKDELGLMWDALKRNPSSGSKLAEAVGLRKQRVFDLLKEHKGKHFRCQPLGENNFQWQAIGTRPIPEGGNW
jgi:hypothetical protein